MGPIETLQDVTGRYYRQLKREGFNPLDLFSWEALISLWVSLAWAGRAGKYDNKELFQRTKQMCWDALERKADAIDMVNENDECAQYLMELRNQ